MTTSRAYCAVRTGCPTTPASGDWRCGTLPRTERYRVRLLRHQLSQQAAHGRRADLLPERAGGLFGGRRDRRSTSTTATTVAAAFAAAGAEIARLAAQITENVQQAVRRIAAQRKRRHPNGNQRVRGTSKLRGASWSKSAGLPLPWRSTGTGREGQYFLEYPEDIRLVGVSFNTVLGAQAGRCRASTPCVPTRRCKGPSGRCSRTVSADHHGSGIGFHGSAGASPRLSRITDPTRVQGLRPSAT